MPDTDLFVSLLTIEVMIPWAQSLKDKRKWQRAIIAVCFVGNDRRRLESDMAMVRQLCEEAQDLQLADIHQQWL